MVPACNGAYAPMQPCNSPPPTMQTSFGARMEAVGMTPLVQRACIVLAALLLRASVGLSGYSGGRHSSLLVQPYTAGLRPSFCEARMHAVQVTHACMHCRGQCSAMQVLVMGQSLATTRPSGTGWS